MVKKLCYILIFCLMLLIVGGCAAEKDKNSDYLRLHVRANSNLESDQNIKLCVRDEVIDYLTPLFQTVNSRNQAEKIVKDNSAKLKKEIDSFLKKNNYDYKCSVQIKDETFPTRKYKDLVLEEGVYRAIIITLGKGEGDNWWCVAYPPLCFTDEDDVTYKSKIWEIIKE